MTEVAAATNPALTAPYATKPRFSYSDSRNSTTLKGSNAPSAVSTPGLDVPGSFPSTQGDRNERDASTEFSSAFQTARQYIPTQEDLTKSFINVTQTAAQYIPAGLASYLPGQQTPLPPNSPDASNTSSQNEDSAKNVENDKSTSLAAAMPLPSNPSSSNSIVHDSKEESNSLPSDAIQDGVTPPPLTPSSTDAVKGFPITHKSSLSSNGVLDKDINATDQTSKDTSQDKEDPLNNFALYSSLDRSASHQAPPPPPKIESKFNENLASPTPSYSSELNKPLPVQPVVNPTPTHPHIASSPVQETGRSASSSPPDSPQSQSPRSSNEHGSSDTHATKGSRKLHKKKPSLKDRIKGEVKVIRGTLTKDSVKVEQGRLLAHGEKL